MKIRLLGTGTSQGIPVIGCECEACLSTNSKDKRLRTSCLIEIDDKRIVIDTGPDFRQQMLQVKTKEIHGVLITHEHYDHIAGLDDIRPYNFKYKKDMPVYALPRVANDIRNKFDYIFKAQPYPGAPKVNLFEISEGNNISISNIDIMPIPVMHGDLPILGYRIQNFAYLTDVKSLDRNTFKYLEGLDLLVLSSLRKIEHHSHLTLKEAISLAQKIKAKKTYFTHFSHLMGKHDEISKELPDSIFAGYDGLEIII